MPRRISLALSRAREPEENERRDGEHQEEVLEHVRAEQVASRQNADGRRQGEKEEQNGEDVPHASSVEVAAESHGVSAEREDAEEGHDEPGSPRAEQKLAGRHRTFLR
jgi:hypothetical protein